MPKYTSILRELPQEKFAEVLFSCGRRVREAVFARHKIRKPRTLSGMPRAGAKTEQRSSALYDCLQTVDDDELCEEILRAWLLTKRPMLAAALDHLGIANDNGLTDSDDVSKIEQLDGAQLKALVEKLAENSSLDEVAIYLKFMGAHDVDETLARIAKSAP